VILNTIAEKLRRQSKDDFKGRHFEAWLIVQAVTWYLRYPLSLTLRIFWLGRSDASPENRRFRDDAHGLFDGCGGSSKRPERNPSFLP
jgi:hypothetical protein